MRMQTRRKTRRRQVTRRLFWVSFGLAVVAALVLSTARFAFGLGVEHPTVLDRPAGTGDALSDQTGADYLNMQPGESRAVGTWTDSSGNPMKVLVAVSNGLPGSNSDGPVTCVILEDPDGSTGGGCNPSDNF